MEWLPISFAAMPVLLPMPEFENKSICLAQLRAWRDCSRSKIPKIVEEIICFARCYAVDKVWVILNHPLLCKIGRLVARKIKSEIIVTVFDPPEYLIRNLGVRPWIGRCLMREFEKIMMISPRCGVMSESMGREYHGKYQTRAVVMRHGVHKSLKIKPRLQLHNETKMVIGFAGSLYACREWESLLSALSEHGWKIGEINVSLVCLTGRRPQGITEAMPIQYLGWLSQEEAVRVLAKVDVAYLPYWFDERYRIATRLSFPSKLSAYVAAGIPVFYHGPDESSVTSFFNRYPIGVCCHSLSTSDIQASLVKFTNTAFYAKFARVTEQAYVQEFDMEVLHDRLSQLLEIPTMKYSD